MKIVEEVYKKAKRELTKAKRGWKKAKRIITGPGKKELLKKGNRTSDALWKTYKGKKGEHFGTLDKEQQRIREKAGRKIRNIVDEDNAAREQIKERLKEEVKKVKYVGKEMLKQNGGYIALAGAAYGAKKYKENKDKQAAAKKQAAYDKTFKGKVEKSYKKVKSKFKGKDNGKEKGR